MTINHADGSTDNRYTVTLENSGRAYAQYIARFCGAWIGCADTECNAWAVALQHNEDRYKPQPVVMPESVNEKALREFTRGYVVALLWSSTDTDKNGNDVDLDHRDLSPCALEKCKADCLAFFTDNRVDLELYAEQKVYDPSHGTAYDYAGHDFALTRNGHGTGFWDREELLPDLARRLTLASESAKGVYVYLGDDGCVYVQ